jgi:hypothetical protein
MSKWYGCKTELCHEHCAVCRTCYKIDPNACEKHTKKQVTIGNYSYCNNYECVKKAICSKCDTHPIKSLVCYGAKKLPSSGGCDEKNTECMKCTSFKSPINSNYGLYCVECFKIHEKDMMCDNCSVASNKRFKCHCCDKRYCNTCDKMLVVDTSPITLYGHGYSVIRHSFYCKVCSKGATEKSIQQKIRKEGEYKCKPHSTLAYVLETSVWIVCSIYKTTDQKDRCLIQILDKDKKALGEFTPDYYEEVRAYCDAHPEKYAQFNGVDYVYPISQVNGAIVC